MDVPTADQIRILSRVPFTDLGWGPGDPDLLQEEIDAAAPLIQRAVGVAFSAVPAEWEATIRRAVRMWVEFQFFASSPEQVEALSDLDVVKSITAGDYTETRRSLAELASSGMLHPWAALNSLLLDIRGGNAVASTTGSDSAGVVRPDRRDCRVAWGTSDWYDMRDGGVPNPIPRSIPPYFW
jgi:hypothetical protein